MCPRTIAQSLDIPYRNGHQYHSLGVQVLTLKERPTDVPKEHLPSKLRRGECQQVVCQENCCGCSGFIFYSIHKDQKRQTGNSQKKTARIKTASAKKNMAQSIFNGFHLGRQGAIRLQQPCAIVFACFMNRCKVKVGGYCFLRYTFLVEFDFILRMKLKRCFEPQGHDFHVQTAMIVPMSAASEVSHSS